ncbi:MAG: hypothetical protein U9N53_06555 [Bacteroidota bacterium]|nr:hypothetical protein [Bacteroidota bacterium]
MTKNTEWKIQSLAYNEDIADALQQQHHAAQFIAMVGKYMIPQKEDDSNTNMQFMADLELLLGNKLPNKWQLVLDLTNLHLSLFDKEFKRKKDIPLSGKTKIQVFDDLKQTLADFDFDVSQLKNELHYEIPSHNLDKNLLFSIRYKNLFQENTVYRHNAEIILNEIIADNQQAEPVRIWPHHFDTGSSIPLTKNNQNKVSSSIGIGWAMPDSMINEPYYYLSFWSEKPDDGVKTLPALAAGQWMVPNWNGAVLKHSEILLKKSPSEQHKLVKSFFTSGMNLLIDKLK